MNSLRYITLILTSLVISFSTPGQSRPYAKFDSGGQTIGLFNLSEKRTDCREHRSMTGSAGGVRFDEHEEDVTVSFIFATGGSRRYVVFTIARKALPRADVENLLNSKGNSRVTACLNEGKWTAEKITKQEVSK